MTSGRIEKIKRDLKLYEFTDALELIENLEKQNAKLKKDKEDEEQMFWYLNNEMAKLKRKIDKIKNKGIKNCHHNNNKSAKDYH